jgi:hypothetical protein
VKMFCSRLVAYILKSRPPPAARLFPGSVAHARCAANLVRKHNPVEPLR